MEPQLLPKLIKPFPCCSEVALGIDHTLFLSKNGRVFSTGKNVHNQLGVGANIKETSTPMQISLDSSAVKNMKTVIGIGASRFHSLCWTKQSLFSWGLNAGQLGHYKEAGKTVPVPKLVTSLNPNINIKSVVTSDGAIIVLTDAGDIISLHEYKTRKITSRHHDVAKLEVLGGNLDHKLLESANSKPFIVEQNREFRVFVLTNLGHLFVYGQQGTRLIACRFNLNREILIQDFATYKTGIILVTKEGLSYKGTFQKKNEAQSPVTTPSKDLKAMTDMAKFVIKNPFELVKLKRVPNVFRGTLCCADTKGNNFCILQLTPNSSLIEIPEVEQSNFISDMKTALESGDEHDVVFVVDGRRYPAHKFIVSAASDNLCRLMAAKSEVQISGIRPQIFEQVLQYVYTKSCDLMMTGKCSVSYHPKAVAEKAKKPGNESLNAAENESNISAFEHYAKGSPRTADDRCCEIAGPQNALEALKEAAKSLRIPGLTSSLLPFSMNNNDEIVKLKNVRSGKTIAFSRNSFPEFHDLDVHCAEDEVTLRAHKCVLSARVEYFRHMLSDRWTESQKSTTISLFLSSAIVEILLEFIYRDEASLVTSSDDVELICNVLVAADQFLIVRLVQICERQLSHLLSLKNCCEVLQFAFNFNAVQLQCSAMQFVSQNVCTVVLENKSLGFCDEEVMRKLSHYYVHNVPALMQRQRFRAPQLIPTRDIKALYETNPLNFDEIFASDRDFLQQQAVEKAASSRKKSIEARNSRRKYSRTTSTSSFSSDLASEISDADAGIDFAEIASKDDDDNDDDEAAANKVNDPEKDQGPKSLQSFFDETTPKQKSEVFNKKFQKKSQRERKKDLHDNNNLAATQSSAFSWRKSSPEDSPELSFSEIMKGQKEEKLDDHQSRQSQATRKKKSSWKQLHFADGIAAANSGEVVVSPWKSLAIASPRRTPEHDAVVALEDIQTTEARKERNFARTISKSLSCVEKEERAIYELSKFYNVENVYDECITVIRGTADEVIAAPVWNRF